MKLRLLAATAAALVAVSPAMAVNYTTTVVLNPTTGAGDIGASHGVTFGEAAGTTFVDTYNFATTMAGTAAAAAISITVSSVPDYLNLTTASLNGGSSVAFTSTVSGGIRNYMVTLSGPARVLPALNSLVINGSVVGNGGTYNGNVSVAAAAVPEAATWAMMVLGFGAIGGALRTSRRKVVFA